MPDTTVAPTLQCRLFELPSEIRDRVYRTLFQHKRIAVEADLDIQSANVEIDDRVSFVLPCQRSSQVLYTCRRILDEARPVLLDNTVFVVRRFACPNIIPYAALNPAPNAGRMRHLEINIAYPDLLRMIVLHVEGETFLKYLKTLKLCCTYDAWIRKIEPDTLWWCEAHFDTYQEVYHEVRKRVLHIWVDSRFTYLEDESIEGENVSFSLWRGKGEDNAESMVRRELVLKTRQGADFQHSQKLDDSAPIGLTKIAIEDAMDLSACDGSVNDNT